VTDRPAEGAAIDHRQLRPRLWRLLCERERTLAIVGLAVVAAGAWAWLLAGAGLDASDGTGMNPAMVMAPRPWSPGHALLVVAMWWAMMAAMMLPGAAPTILLYDRVVSKQPSGRPVHTAWFAAGYLLVWGGFSLAAAVLHWALDQGGWLTMGKGSASTALGGVLLIGAGLWQLTPLKHACLAHCRGPLHFLAHRWRHGGRGALRMGVEHGAYCLGCCWVLMGLLFYGGVMSVAWIGGLALYVLIEKLTPAGHWIGTVTGMALIAWGGAVLALAVL
jgi:predicted metal-binding membrane protein